jgi:hypothetical protein
VRRLATRHGSFALLGWERAVRILGGVESSGRTGELAGHVLENIARHPAKALVAGRLFRLEAVNRDLRLIVEHLLEMRHQPTFVHRVAMKAPADMIVDPAPCHRT